MGLFMPVTFRTARGCEFKVATLHDVIRALSMAWPDKARERYRTLPPGAPSHGRLVEGLAGWAPF